MNIRTMCSVVLAVLVIATCTVSSFAQDATEKQVKVKLEQPIVMGQTKNTEASIAELNRKAVELGISDLRIMGNSSYSKAETGATRTYIDWHSIKMNSEDQNISEQLPSSLSSQFTTDQERAEVGTLISATGDWEGVLKALGNIKKEEAEKVQKVESVDEENDSSSTPSNAPASPSTSSFSDQPYENLNTDVQTTTYEDCPVFVSEGDKTVYEQKAKKVTGESGTVYEEGICQNTGVTWPIRSKPGDCTYQFNFEEGIAYEMEQWYYEKDGDAVDVGECRQSNSTYPLVEFKNVCEIFYDEANDLVFPQTRWGSLVGDVPVYATECEPQSNESYEVQTEYVRDDNGTIETEDDFTNHISYPLVDKFYDHPDKGKVYVARSIRSTSESYPHKHETSECGWVMDDENLSAQQLSNTYIETSEGIQILQGCEARTSPVPYAFLGQVEEAAVISAVEDPDSGEFITENSYVVPEGATKLSVRIVGPGKPGERASGSCSVGGCGPVTSASCTQAISISGGGAPGGEGGMLREYEVNATAGETLSITTSTELTTLTASFGSFEVVPGNGTEGEAGTNAAIINGYTKAQEGGAGGAGVLLADGERYGQGGHGGGWSCIGRAYNTGIAVCPGGGSSPKKCAVNNGDGYYGRTLGQVGAVEVSYKVLKYLRPDGTTFIIPESK